MSLNGALQIGRSAMVAAQAGIQVAGNNMANAGTVGYSRQVLHLAPASPERFATNQFMGRGVNIERISRSVDLALQSRLRDAVSDEHGAMIDQRFLTSIETLQNELTDNDLSTLLSEFFNSFSELANNPEDNAVRAVVIQQGVNLADRVNELRHDYDTLRQEVDRDIGASAEAADNLLTQLAEINRRIADTEQGVGEANALRDQRDQIVNELAQYMEVSTVEQPNGAVDIFVGSTPIVLAGESRGVELRSETVDSELVVSVRVRDDGTRLDMQSGRLGALLRQREETVQPGIDDLDAFAAQLIFQVNRLHSQGQGQSGFTGLTGSYRVDDTTANLNHADADLPFRIENGSFLIHMTHAQTGARSTYQIEVDGDAMSLEDLVDEINISLGAGNVTAGISADNELTLNAADGYELSFSEDSSGALAALGVNTFFVGESASDIAVNVVVQDEPRLLAAGAGHVDGSNGTALALASLQDTSVEALGGRSLRESWQHSVSQYAVRADAANGQVGATRLVRESIAAQAQAVSGVSLDEEAINLLTFQRQFQAAARFIAVIDETMQTLLSIT